MPLLISFAALGVAMVAYVRRTLAKAKQMENPRAFGQRIFARGAVGIALSLAAGWLLPVPDDAAALSMMRGALLFACVLSTTWLLAGVGVLESAARRGSSAR